MYSNPLAGVWWSSIVLLANALTITFYNDNNCQDTPLGSRALNLDGKDKLGECYEDFAGRASSAKVKGLTDKKRENHVVVDFYSLPASQACQGEEVASKDNTSETDGGCVQVGHQSHYGRNRKAFRFYAAVSPGGYSRIPLFTDEEREMDPEIGVVENGHGSYWKGPDGKVFRYQQIAEGMWRDFLAEEWDDK